MSRGIDGVVVDDHDPDNHSATCIQDWLGQDWAGRPRRCGICRPKLVRLRRRIVRPVPVAVTC